MSDRIKISEMPLADSTNGFEIAGVQGGANKRLSLTRLLARFFPSGPAAEDALEAAIAIATEEANAAAGTATTKAGEAGTARDAAVAARGVVDTKAGEVEARAEAARLDRIGAEAARDQSANSALASAASAVAFVFYRWLIAQGATGLDSAEASGTAHPIAVDGADQLAFGIDKATGYATGLAFPSLETQRVIKKGANDTAFGAAGLSYMPDADLTGVWPIIPDAVGRVFLGVEIATGNPVGTLVDDLRGQAGSGTYRVPATPLATGDQMPLADVSGIVVDGQSLAQGNRSALLSTTALYGSLTFGSGTKSNKPGSAGTNNSPGTATLAPLVEDAALGYSSPTTPRGETPCSGYANTLAALAIIGGANPAGVPVFASAPGHDSYSITQLEQGSAWGAVLTDHLQAAPGLVVASGKSFAWQALGWIQGEEDQRNGMARATYLSKMKALRTWAQGTARTADGKTGPLYLLTYQTTDSIVTYNGVSLAQLDAAREEPAIIMAGPIYHLPRASDGVHLVGTSSKWLGAQMGKLHQQIRDRKERPIRPDIVSAVAIGTRLRLRFQAPWLPLVLDVASLGLATQYGFRLVDDTGDVTLTAMAVSGDTVTATLSRSLGANPKIRYALDYLGAGMTISGGASGNLRDSDPTTAIIDLPTNDIRPLYNWMPAFEHPVAAIG